MNGDEKIQPIALTREEGEALWFLGVLAIIKASGETTGGRCAIIEHLAPRGAGSVKKYLNERGLKRLAALDEAAQRTGTTPARVAIAWVMAQPGVTAPIASASTLEQLDELFEASQMVLDAATLDLLNRASAEG